MRGGGSRSKKDNPRLVSMERGDCIGKTALVIVYNYANRPV